MLITRFYLMIRPCRRVKPGEYWEGRSVSTRFRGASIRSNDTDPTMPVREVIGRCDKLYLSGRYNNGLAWMRFELGDFRAPESPYPWNGDPSTDCTHALLDVFNRRGASTVQSLQMQIRSARECLEHDKHPTTRAMLERRLERLERELRLTDDGGCDLW